MEQQNTPTSAQPAAALLQAYVDYLPGISIVGAESALLEWSADNRIRFFKMDAEKQVATEVLFDVPLSEIEHVSGSMIMLTFTVAGKKYNAQFSRTGAAVLGLGGLAGISLAHSDSVRSGIKQWVSRLQEHNVSVKHRGLGWSAIVALIAVGAIVLIALIVILMRGVNT